MKVYDKLPWKKVSDESKKTIVSMSIYEFGMLCPHAHIANYGFQQASGIYHRLVPSSGMLYADADFWTGTNNLLHLQGASRLIV
jgi:hypothetical protein